MSLTKTFILGLALTAALAILAPAAGARVPDRSDRVPQLVEVQLLAVNDFHGNLEPPAGSSGRIGTVVAGGVQYLATHIKALEATNPNTLVVSAGDLIGASPLLSALFHDEPSIEAFNLIGLDFNAVGNHEFDEGTTELLRMQGGGCHPEDGCYFPDEPYKGAQFQWLAANVVKKNSDDTLLPATSVKTVNGVKVGFIGMTLEATPTLVSPTGVASVDFKDEVETANKQAALLKAEGVKSIVVLLHEGGYQSSTINGCEGISAPIAQIAAQMTAEVDQIISGHTHQGYICSLPDPEGNPRLVTSAADYGRVVTETNLVINTKSGDVVREKTAAVNHLVNRGVKDPAQSEIIAKWNTLAGPLKAEIVGSHTEPILGDSGGNRGIETPMADLVADAIHWGTSGSKGGAQIAFMNVGGVREDLPMAPKYAEASGQITFAEAYDIAPFNNLLVTVDLTGDQIRQILEQQYQPIPARGSRPMLALGVSKGFTYEWDATNPQGSRVVNGSMKLNGVPLMATETYRVGTLNFLADGGDSFTAFTQGTNRLGGAEDLQNLVDFFKANPALRAPEDRVAGL